MKKLDFASRLRRASFAEYRKFWSGYRLLVTLSGLLAPVLALLGRGMHSLPSLFEVLESGAVGLVLSASGTYLYSRRKGAEALDSDWHRKVSERDAIIKELRCSQQNLLAEKDAEIERLTETVRQRTELSPKATEILLAAYEGLKSRFPGIMVINTMQESYVRAGRVTFSTDDPTEAAEYMSEIQPLLDGDWIARPAWDSPDYYELAAKGLKKAKGLFCSSEGSEIMAEIHRKFDSK